MSRNTQKPWRELKGWVFPYSDPVEKDKKWLKDRKELFAEGGNDWYVKLWNRIW